MEANRDRLNAIREVQAVTGPNFCLASAKFFCGKLVGLFDGSKHLNDFLSSRWAVRQDRARLKAAWGLFAGARDFNTRVLKAAVEEADANVKAPGPPVARSVEFVSGLSDATLGDQLLAQRVPIVIGVDLPGGYARDHFIALVAEASGALWAVDSWDASTYASAVQLPAGTTLARKTTVEMNAGSTTIPCRPLWFGYYRDGTTLRPLPVRVGL